MSELRLGIFDSGIGGFSVLKEVLRLLPGLDCHYIADNAFFPYGDKSDEEIIDRAHQLTNMLMGREVNAILIACNTATASAIKELRASYQLPFVGIEPFLNIENHAEFPRLERKIVVLTTVSTSQSAKFKRLKEQLDPTNKMDLYPCLNLAKLIEKGFWRGIDEDLLAQIMTELNPLKSKGYTHALLGCTHYSLIDSFLEEYLQLKTVSPGKYVARRVCSILEQLKPEYVTRIKEGGPTTFHFCSTAKHSWENINSSLLFSTLFSKDRLEGYDKEKPSSPK